MQSHYKRQRLLFAIVLSLIHLMHVSVTFGQTYKAISFEGLPAYIRVGLASGAAPLWYSITEEGATMESVIRDLCGDQGELVDNYLLEKATILNRIVSAYEAVPKGSTIAVPFCFRVNAVAPVRISEGDTVEGLLRQYYGDHHPKDQEAVFSLNADKYPGMSEEEFFRHLRPDSELVLPFVPETRTFTWQAETFKDRVSSCGSGCSITLRDLINWHSTTRFIASLERVDGIANPHLFQSVPFVKAEEAEGDSHCIATADGYKSSVLNLLARYAMEVDALAKEGATPQKVVIGVVDTGLERKDGFFEGLIEENIAEKDANEDRDDDVPKNGFIDDILGISLEAKNGSIYSSPTDNPIGHGTKVSTVAVAGIDFELWLDERELSPTKLKIVNYSSNLPRGGVDPTVLSEAPIYLANMGISIVNMSLSSTYKPLPLELAIASEPELLLVVAAGNSKSDFGAKLGPMSLYPALFGGRIGDYSRRVITVGAHDELGQLAGFSNRSNEYVDLLAPGKCVKTRDERGLTVFENGTSISAAVVSFTASLVKSLGVKNPAQLKNRILASVDYDPEIAAHAWSSGRLNPEKAISLRHDVVELTDQIHFGDLQAPDGIPRLCGSVPVWLNMTIRKIIPNIVEGEKTYVEYWVESDGKLHRERCVQKSSDPQIVMLMEGSTSTTIPLALVRDIVPAHL